MMTNAMTGMVAGAAGTTALNLTSYGDILLRGRASSSLPAEVVRRLAAKAGISPLDKPDEQSDEATKNRRSGAGSLIGYGVGLSIGSAYGTARPFMRWLPWPVMGVVLAAAAMAASDVPASMLEVTDPSTWELSSWIADILPHAAYGMVTALTFEYLER